jgi:predicted DNA-binding protein (UPF0278 family)
MTKKLDVVDDVQLLKTKIDQTNKALSSKLDNKFKEEIRGNFNNLNKDMQNCKDEVIKGANEIKKMYEREIKEHDRKHRSTIEELQRKFRNKFNDA